MKSVFLLYIVLFSIIGCNQLSESAAGQAATAIRKEQEAILCTPGAPAESKGTEGDAHSVPGTPNSIRASAEKFSLVPALGRSSWAAFTPYQDSSLLVGDIIITGTDLATVHNEIDALGIEVTDFHLYPTPDRSVIMYMHIIGFGNREKIALNANILSESLRRFSRRESKEEKIRDNESRLNQEMIDSIIGRRGEIVRDVYRHDELRVTKNASTEGQFNTWASWQTFNENTVVAGAITMRKEQVEPILKILAENKFQLIHNQLVKEDQGVFLLHYWAVGTAEQLAKTLRDALKQ